jgi:hypothetical protein
MSAPQRARAVKQDLDGIIAKIIERGVGDDSNFSVLKQAGTSWEVTFAGSEHVSIAMDDIEYTDIHRELTVKRSYNLKLLDGGLLQLMYRFEGDWLAQHRLAWISTDRESPNAGVAYLIHLTQEFCSDRY